eukprot:12976647-Alexandrium_andersonii.AAC.1
MALVPVARDLGVGAGLRARAGSSAAIGVCRRPGIGRARRLAMGQLWAQERVRSGECELAKWPGEQNPAD